MEKPPPLSLECSLSTPLATFRRSHVPAADIRRLLAERPKAIGLAVPGMPMGSPGMEQGGRTEPYVTVLFGEGGGRVFARH